MAGTYQAPLGPSVDAFDHHIPELYQYISIKKNMTKYKIKAPVSGGRKHRKEGLRVPVEGDKSLNKAGLADAKRPFLTTRF
jgi:hypothetical protein